MPLCLLVLTASSACAADLPSSLSPFFTPPPDARAQADKYRSPLIFNDGSRVRTPADWTRRRREILDYWTSVLGPWPDLIQRPNLEILESTPREDFQQQRIRIETAPGQMTAGYLLIPKGPGPFPAVLAVFYDPETSAGLAGPKGEFRDYAYQLTRRGFVTLSIGSPGGDARKPDRASAVCQPLYFLAYIAANCHTALTQLPQVDPSRIGGVGHSYGGKWAMFASCFYDKFAAAAWSDPGIVFDESRPNINYWEPWYLGLDPALTRKPGIVTPQNPRTGAYKRLIQEHHDLHELHALMAPRPFLVSGGSEDPPERWAALIHTVSVNDILGQKNRVAMTNRPNHNPTAESNEVLYSFFTHFLGTPAPGRSSTPSP